jgi:hypothetical protein
MFHGTFAERGQRHRVDPWSPPVDQWTALKIPATWEGPALLESQKILEK